jgi:hypothetical protein
MAAEHEPGLWLTAEELAGPLPGEGLALRRWALEQAMASGTLAAPSWLPVLRALQQEAAALALESGNHDEAERFERAEQTLHWSLEALTGLNEPERQRLRHELAGHSSQLIGGLHRLLLGDGSGPVAAERSPWLERAAQLARWHRQAGLDSPAWLGPVEEQLARAAALAGLERARGGADSAERQRARGLLEQLAELHSPCPEWIRLAQQELGSQPADTATSAAQATAPLPWRPALRLELRPGEPELIVEAEALVLNPAERLEAAAADRLGLWFAEVLQGVRSQRTDHPLQLAEPESSLHRSLQRLWREGRGVPAAAFRGLALAADHWRRSGGEAVAPWADFPAGRLEEGCLLVRPGNVELAALRTALEQPQAQGPALEAIARRGHDRAWMEALRPDWWCEASDATENLRRLHTNAGFYADPADPLGCLAAWQGGTLAALRRGQVVSGHITAWMAPVSQALALGEGVVPELVQWPGDGTWYRFLAGKRVLFVTPLAADVQQQHASGRAFNLFHDLAIEPYALRCLPAPMSVHPNRPDGGFRASLERCLAAVEAAWREEPFDVFTAACGAYGLPLCAAVHERHGATCVYTGNVMHALFGVLQQTTADWRAGSRKEENWRSSQLLNGVAGVERIEGGRYLGLPRA